MIDKRMFIREMMMRRIKRVYGKRSHFRDSRHGWYFDIKAEINGGLQTLQTIKTETDTKSEAVEYIYNMACSAGDACKPELAFPSANTHPLLGQV